MEEKQQTTEWLERHTGNTILIRKEEQGDLDTIEVRLDRIDYKQESGQGWDDYTDGSALLLHGTGQIIVEQDRHPLPGDTFVIPVKGLSEINLSDRELRFQTERASYRLTVQ